MATSSLFLLAIGTFVATNVDNALLWTALLAVAPAQRRAAIRRGIVAAAVLLPLLGIALRVVLVELPPRAFVVLAIVPACYAVRAALALRTRGPDAPPHAKGMVGAFLVTAAISADNLAAYLPLLRATSLVGDAVVALLWAATAVGLVALSSAVADHPRVVAVATRIGHVAEPILYLVLVVLIVVATTVR